MCFIALEIKLEKKKQYHSWGELSFCADKSNVNLNNQSSGRRFFEEKVESSFAKSPMSSYQLEEKQF